MIDLNVLNEFQLRLGHSPIYNLSLSSKELFHSNFLGWLTETYKADMTKVWSSYLLDNESWGEITNVYREQKNRDLTFQFKNRKRLIVEVKVKSAPDPNQLADYLKELRSESIKKFSKRSAGNPQIHANSDDFQLALLSFFDLLGRADKEQQSFMVDGTPCPWIPWTVLSKNIRSAFSHLKDNYHRALITDYCDFIDQFGEIVPSIEVDWDNGQNFFLDDSPKKEVVHEKLKELRLHDLVYKIRYASLAQRLVDKMATMGCRKADWKEGKPGEFLTESTMTNATGVTSIGYVLARDHQPDRTIVAGIQLQHRSYRFFLLAMGCEKSDIQACAVKIFKQKLWFQIDGDELQGISANVTMRKDFCQYSGHFFYKYRNINNPIPPEKLVNMMVEHIMQLKKCESEIMKIIDADLKG